MAGYWALFLLHSSLDEGFILAFLFLFVCVLVCIRWDDLFPSLGDLQALLSAGGWLGPTGCLLRRTGTLLWTLSHFCSKALFKMFCQFCSKAEGASFHSNVSFQIRSPISASTPLTKWDESTAFTPKCCPKGYSNLDWKSPIISFLTFVVVVIEI